MPVIQVDLKPGVKGHPMEQKAIAAIMNGESFRSVSRWLDPPVSHAAVQRYVHKHMKPAIANAEILSATLKDQPNERLGRPPRNVSPPVSQTPLHSETPASQRPSFLRPYTPDDALQRCGAVTSTGQLARQALAAAPILRIRENRIAFQQELADRLASVIQERGEEMAVCEACGREKSEHPAVGHPDGLKDCSKFRRIPGGSSGLMTRRIKKDGVEYHYDNAIVASAQELMKQTAIEQGQWQENMGTGAPTIQIICPQVPGELPRVSFHSDDAIDGEFADIGLDQGR